MHYIIDGYNLLFRTRFDSETDFKQFRDNLIHSLAEKIAKAHLSATLVFDSYRKAGLGEKQALSTLDIYFTDEGMTADDYIAEAIKKAAHPKQITVVTSDKRLAWACRRRGSHSISSEEFHALLNRLSQRKEKKEVVQKPPEMKVKKKLKTQMDRWLEAFEKEESPNESESKHISKEPQKLIKREKPLSDMERWLKAFDSNFQ